MDRPTVAGRALAQPRQIGLVEGGVHDAAQLDLAPGHESDRDAEMGNGAGEIRGAIDRIDHPDLIARRAAGFLAQKAVLGEGLGQAGADMRFDRAIGLGQVILRPLHADGPALLLAESVEGEDPCTREQIPQEGLASGHVIIRERHQQFLFARFFGQIAQPCKGGR